MNILALFLSPFFLNAQSIPLSVGARAGSTGFTSLCINDEWSTINNQAGLAYIQNFSLGAYFENRFLLKEMGTKTGIINIPLTPGALGISFIQVGDKHFSESKIGISFGHVLYRTVSAGIQLDYYHLSVSDIDVQSQILSCQVALMAYISDDLILASRIINPAKLHLQDSDLPDNSRTIQVGVSYSIGKQFIIHFQTDKHFNYKPNVKVGAEYFPGSGLRFGMGVNTNPVCSYFGFGLKIKRIRLDISSSIHQTLGIYPQASVTYITSD